MVTSMSTVPTRHEAWCDVAAHDAGNAVEPGPCSSRAVTVERVSVWLVEDGRSDLAAVAVDTAFGAVLTPSDARTSRRVSHRARPGAGSRTAARTSCVGSGTTVARCWTTTPRASLCRGWTGAGMTGRGPWASRGCSAGPS
jgi:hypothetical protein